MKKILLSLGFLAVATTGAYAQVGIGTDDPNKSAQLDITSDPERRGLLIPRLELSSLTERLSEKNPVGTDQTYANAHSLLIFNTTAFGTSGEHPAGYYYWDGAKWVHLLSTAAESVANIFNNDASSVIYNPTDKTLKVRAENGLEVLNGTGGKPHVVLGGALTKNTELTGLGTYDLSLKGLKDANAPGGKVDGVVVLDGDVVKRVEKLGVEKLKSEVGNEGKVLVTNASGEAEWGQLTNQSEGLDLSGLAGDGLTYDVTNKELDVDAVNGIKVEGGKVKLGAPLTELTTITTTESNPLIIDGPKDNTNLQFSNLATGAPSDEILVVDSSNKVKKVSALTAGKVDYVSTPVLTGRKWLPSSTNKDVKEVVLNVDFATGATFVTLPELDTDSGTTRNITIISIRFVSDPTNDDNDGSLVQSIKSYDSSTGKLSVGTPGSFSPTLKGKYIVILEYFEN